MSERRLWTQQEDCIIDKLVQKHGSKKWTQIAQDMKINYPQLARSSKQIRQRWYNHLDPDINRNSWTEQQQLIIFQTHKKIGSKWKQIAKLLVARTDNSVKNHFYSTLRRSLRRINKYLGFKNSTNQMRVLKPSILCRLIQNSQNSEQFRSIYRFLSLALIDSIFQFSNFKPNKSTKTEQDSFIGNQKKILKQAIQKLTQFNHKYDRNQFLDKKKLKKNSKRKHTKDYICQSVTTELSLNENKNIVKIQLQEINFGEEETSKGVDSIKQRVMDIIDIQFQNNWEQSNHNQFLNLLPEFEKPQQDQEFLSMECEQQEIFL